MGFEEFKPILKENLESYHVVKKSKAKAAASARSAEDADANASMDVESQ